MADKINYYVDKEEPDSVFKYDWNTHTGYIWNYPQKAWVTYGPVLDYIYDGGNLRCVKEKEAMEAIKENS